MGESKQPVGRSLIRLAMAVPLLVIALGSGGGCEMLASHYYQYDGPSDAVDVFWYDHHRTVSGRLPQRRPALMGGPAKIDVGDINVQLPK